MSDDTVLYEVRDGVVWLRLNDPGKLNALGLDGWLGITQGLRRAARESRGPVVLIGTGRAFCAGDDIAAFTPLSRDLALAERFFIDGLYSSFEAIVTHPTPVIAAVNGLAFGGGLELVAAADLAVSVRSATFGIPEGKLGAFAGVFSALSTTHFTFKAANDFAYRMPTYDAEQAKQLGIINSIVDEDQLEQEVTSIVAEINAASPESIRVTKRFLATRAREESLPRIKAALRAVIDEMLPTENLAEGTAAFFEKREPSFLR